MHRYPAKRITCVAVIVLSFVAAIVYSHCQIPCGIYNDKARLDMIREHIATIQKSIKSINELSKEDAKNYNQIVRWVNNKDAHADELSEIATYYFLAQRVKPVDQSDVTAYNEYLAKLEQLHKIVYYSMKTKQGLESENVEKLTGAVDQFEKLYFTEEDGQQQTKKL